MPPAAPRQPLGPPQPPGRRRRVASAAWLLALLLAASVRAGGASGPSPQPGDFKAKVVCIGDSITHFGFVQPHGWGQRLREHLAGQADVLDYGIGGATTRKVDQILSRALSDLRYELASVKLVTICFGANDAVTPRAPAWHVPLPVFKAKLAWLVAQLRARGINNIVFITPPPVASRRDRDNADTARYAEAVRAVAANLNLPAVDIHAALMQVPRWETAVLEKDGLHLSPPGQGILFAKLMPVVRRLDLGTPNLPVFDSERPPIAPEDVDRLLEALNRTALHAEEMMATIERSAAQAGRLMVMLDRTGLQASTLLSHIEASAQRATEVLSGEIGHIGQRQIKLVLLGITVLLALWLVTDKAPVLSRARFAGLLPVSCGAGSGPHHGFHPHCPKSLPGRDPHV